MKIDEFLSQQVIVLGNSCIQSGKEVRVGVVLVQNGAKIAEVNTDKFSPSIIKNYCILQFYVRLFVPYVVRTALHRCVWEYLQGSPVYGHHFCIGSVVKIS